MALLRRQVNKLELAETDLMQTTTVASQRCVALESEAQQQLAAMARVRDQLAGMTAAKNDADKQIAASTATLLQRQEEVCSHPLTHPNTPTNTPSNTYSNTL